MLLIFQYKVKLKFRLKKKKLRIQPAELIVNYRKLKFNIDNIFCILKIKL